MMLPEEHLLNLCLNKKVSVGVAESCTGGAIASKITNIPGASNYFLGAIIAYNISVKQTILKVPSKTIEKYGVVSNEVAKAMALGARSCLKVDYAISTTGVAGPDPSADGPVGKLCIGVALPSGKVETFEHQLTGNREDIIQKASHAALVHLIEALK